MGIWLLLSGIVGAVASFLLLYERIQLWADPTHSTACDVNPWVSCGAVMESWQAATFGFPNIFIGVVAFPLLILSALVILAAGKKLQHSRVWWIGMQVGATFALGFTIWLWYSAVYQIGVLCPYCMIVWAAVIPFFFIVTARNIIHGVFSQKTSRKLKEIAQQWWWVMVVMAYLLVILSIILEFPYLLSW